MEFAQKLAMLELGGFHEQQLAVPRQAMVEYRRMIHNDELEKEIESCEGAHGLYLHFQLCMKWNNVLGGLESVAKTDKPSREDALALVKLVRWVEGVLGKIKESTTFPEDIDWAEIEKRYQGFIKPFKVAHIRAKMAGQDEETIKMAKEMLAGTDFENALD